MENKKRRGLRMGAILAALVLMAGLAACGGESTSSQAPVSSAQSSEAASEAASSEAASSEAASSEAEESSEAQAGTGMFATVADYLADPAMKQQLDALAEALEGSGMTMTIEAEGNALVYDYTFSTEMDDATREAAAAALEDSLAQQADTFSSIAATLQQAVETDGVSVIVRYRDSNGDLLTEQSFSAYLPTTTSSIPSASTPSPSITIGEQNALSSAKDYLNVMPFSYSGLIDQLKYEGYSDDEAKYGADNCGADWNEQAAKAAQNYLEIMSFSRQGLIDQLEYEGYTPEQAEYGVSAVGY